MAQRDIVEDACAVLRAHGINAYEQGGEVVIFAASTSNWTPVASFSTYTMSREQIIEYIAMKLSTLVAGPHTHEVLV